MQDIVLLRLLAGMLRQLDTSDLVLVVSSYSTADYCSPYWQLLDVSRFANMLLDSQSKIVFDCRGLRQDSDTGA